MALFKKKNIWLDIYSATTFVHYRLAMPQVKHIHPKHDPLHLGRDVTCMTDKKIR